MSVSIPKPLPLPPPPPPIKFELPLLEVALMFCEGNRPTLKILDLKKRRKDQKNVTNNKPRTKKGVLRSDFLMRNTRGKAAVPI